MPKIRPAPAEARARYRGRLPRKAQPLYEALVELVAAPFGGLGWYHRLGQLMGQLHEADTATTRGQAWAIALARALGPSPSLLRKARQFAVAYPSPGDLAALERLGATWTHLMLTLAVKSEKARHRLIRAAAREGWSDQRLWFEAQRAQPGPRRGVGGRPRKVPGGFGPEVTLRELGRLAGRWLDFHTAAWSKVTPAEWEQLLRSWPAGERDRLRELLRQTGRDLAGVARACAEDRRALADLRRRLG
jgi:hypothetical protein